MATEGSRQAVLEGGSGATVRRRYTQNLALVVSGNTTVTGTFTLPVGSYLRGSGGMIFDTPVAITGTPTSCLVRMGITLHGQEIVADVDCKAQGHISATVVAAFDNIGSQPTTVFVEVTTSGGTSSAGTINLELHYAPPST